MANADPILTKEGAEGRAFHNLGGMQIDTILIIPNTSTPYTNPELRIEGQVRAISGVMQFNNGSAFLNILDDRYITIASDHIITKQVNNTISDPDMDIILSANTSQPNNITGVSNLRGIWGGYDNIIESTIASNIFGSHHSIMQDSVSGHNSIHGGSYIDLTSSYSSVVGGTDIVINASRAVFVGSSESADVTANGYVGVIGANNPTINSTASYIFCGASQNCSITGASNHMTILGGTGNSVSGGFGLVCQGDTNTATNTRATVVNGINNDATASETFVGNGNNNNATFARSFIGNGVNNTASRQSAFVGNGSGNTASGNYSAVLNGEGCTAPSYAEIVMGSFPTTYTHSSATAVVATDRLFTLGRGTATGSRADAVKVYKNGNVEIDGTVSSAVSPPTAAEHLTRKDYVDSSLAAANRSVLNDSYTTVKTTAELEADYPSVPLPYYVIAKNTTGNPIIYIKHSVNVWMFQPLGFTS